MKSKVTRPKPPAKRRIQAETVREALEKLFKLAVEAFRAESSHNGDVRGERYFTRCARRERARILKALKVLEVQP